ncbi:hypothetical protein [Streptomyces sp. NPDC060194]|uniref:hypothetical protein n=1 Tax=Streptomyces sp. NPDC060194 TaxID=3347069 RepID=UPI0036595500
MRFTDTALAIGLVVATSLPLAPAATAGMPVDIGRITATDYAAGVPATVTLDPATGSVTATFARAAEDGVLSPKGTHVASVQRRDTCIPQDEGCMYARDLVVTTIDGGDRRVLVQGVQPEDSTAPYVGHPDWAPNGKHIAYDSPRGLEWTGTDGTGAEVLTAGSRGTFSPDSRNIAFLRTTSYETPGGTEHGTDLHILNLATRQVRAITSDHQVWSAAADWSPDGRRLVHSTGRALRVSDVASGTITELPTALALDNLRDPVFSPDGHQIAFTALDETTGASGIYVTDTDGNNLRKLIDSPVTVTDWVTG